MSRTVVISDDLAELLEIRREKTGHASIDEVVVALIAEGLLSDPADNDHDAGYTTEELRALIAEAEAGGPAELWSPKVDLAEIRRRQAIRSGRSG